jgi:biopolymer transport protein TolR
MIMRAASSRNGHADLNVTPMIDVVLVLLIIFMVVTPNVDQQVPVVVPQDAPQEQLLAPPSPAALVVRVSANGSLALNDTAVTGPAELTVLVQKAIQRRQDKVVFLDAHGDVLYEHAMAAVDASRSGGAEHVGFISPLP